MSTQKSKSTRIPSLIALYDMHTGLFPKAIDGISEKDAQNRLNTKANHAAWITGSLVQERFEMAKLLGIDMKQKADGLFKDHKGIQDDGAYPALAEFISDWEKISPVLREALVNVSDEQLDTDLEMPWGKYRVFEMITFFTYREANCIGQLALWRRLLGYDPMKYM